MIIQYVYIKIPPDQRLRDSNYRCFACALKFENHFSKELRHYGTFRLYQIINMVFQMLKHLPKICKDLLPLIRCTFSMVELIGMMGTQARVEFNIIHR